MKIILADDNQSIRLSLAEFLRDAQHEVQLCKNGQEVLQMLKTWKADVVLSDIQMPELDGIALLKSIKGNAATKSVEVLLFTGYGDVKGAVEAIRLGAYDYLLKPVNIRELDVQLLRLGNYLALKREHRDLSERFEAKVNEATGEMAETVASLQAAFAREIGTGRIGIFSEQMIGVYERADRLHQNPDIPVLIEGETGTGKEMLARYIHFGRGQVTKPFIAVNCAALASSLFESEIFGYEAGAFTGGLAKGQKGKIELAGDGTLFLDEITEMPVEHQAKLLRVLQEREFYRVGGLKTRSAEARFICSTNQSVDAMVQEGQFRQDLFYRLNVGHIRIPPLRERRSAVVPLAQMFLTELQQKKSTAFRKIHPEAERLMTEYDWPGNVRELKNAMERIVLYWNEAEISPEHIRQTLPGLGKGHVGQMSKANTGLHAPPMLQDGFNLDTHILDIVEEAMMRSNGNQTQAAQLMKISVRRLHTHLKHIEARRNGQ